MPAATALHTAVLIGRFQPLHHGHMGLLQAALERAPQLIVVLGSAYQARSPKNPFDWQERAALIRASLPAHDVARIQFVPMRDYYDNARWVAEVRQAVQALLPAGSPPEGVGLVGHFKDGSSSYLAMFPGWQLISLPRQGQFDGTPLRDGYWNLDEAAPEQWQAALQALAPPAVSRFLSAWAASPAYASLQEEARLLRSHHQAWAVAPYPPVLVTVDALVLCAGHVLLVERGQHPGKGLLALPGGFLEQQDSLWQSCLRELAEETGWAPFPQDAAAALRGVLVFDHPYRSLRGRTITHVHVLDWPAQQLPAVQGADDAARALWLPLAELAAHEAQFFEDHFHILRHSFAQLGLGVALP